MPKGEIFDRSDFPDFYTIKSSWVGDLVVKILKGLSHEIDFKNFDKNLQNLA